MLLTDSSDVLAQIGHAGGASMVERLLFLDGVQPRALSLRPLLAPTPQDALDYDVLLLGGGLSLLFAPLLAARGLRVAVYERQSAGAVHREWNASMPELQTLCDVGLLTPTELQTLVVARYDAGICRWHGGGTHRVTGVLDCAVDAGALLALARSKAQESGVTLFDNQSAGPIAASGHGVRVQLKHAGLPYEVTARVVLDGRGAKSPYAVTDLVCPTVGGVLEGLTEGEGPSVLNPRLGEILVTTEDVQDGHQHLWETFPGRPGQAAVYLFYYARRDQVAPGALQALYRRFLAQLRHYKHGPARLVRPTFGYIPGWSRLTPGPMSPHPRIVLVGDAAARQSPLTFCGFGAMLRSLAPVVHTAARLARDGVGPKDHSLGDRGLHSATGALALMMAQSDRLAPQALNGLLDAAFGSLAAMGNPTFAALLQDTMPLVDFVRFLKRISKRHPVVYQHVWQALGPTVSARWGLRVSRLLATEMVVSPQDPLTA